MELLGASVEGNVDTLLHALRYDIAVERVESPTAALEYARRLAQHGVPVNALVRAYRLGQRQMNEIVFAEVRAVDIPEPARSPSSRRSPAPCSNTSTGSRSRSSRCMKTSGNAGWRTRTAFAACGFEKSLAANKAVDADASSTSIRYPLRWHHLAVIMWCPDEGTEGDELASLQRFLRELAQAAGADANPLFVAADRLCGYGWLPFRAEPSDAVARRSVQPTPRSAGTARVWRSGRWHPASRDSAGRTAKRWERAPSRWPAVRHERMVISAQSTPAWPSPRSSVAISVRPGYG